jgi:hypothetical protein
MVSSSSLSSTHTGRPLGLPASARRIVTRSRETFRGYVPSAKPGNDYRLVGYESLLERDFIHLAEDDPAIVSYREQDEPFEFRIGPERHKHWPDFALTLADGRRVCVAVKPAAVIRKRNLGPVFEAIGDGALTSGRFDVFQVWTDVEIREPVRLRNARLRNTERGPYEDLQADLAVESALHALGGRASVLQLRDASGLGETSFRAVVRLMARGCIAPVDPAVLIEDRTIVSSPSTEYRP